MRAVERTVVGLAMAIFLSPGPELVSAQSADTITRRTTATELHAQRRAWLEARRTGALSDAPPVYGTAVVGATGLGPVASPVGGTPVICTGILGGPAYSHPGGVSFRGDCRPQFNASGGFTDRPPWGVQEYGWNGWGWSPQWPFGWSVDPSAGYAFSWPGYAAGECVRVQIAAAGAPPIDMLVALQALGVVDAADLDLAIEARLARGQPVDLYGLDGRRVRIEPGTLLDDVRVLPCTR
jgi:hypothetical protein